MLVVGSTAMRYLVEGCREPKDFDVFTNDPLVEDMGGDRFWHPDFEDWFFGDRFATLDELYTIKVSHSYWQLENGSWLKHMSDIVALKDAGAVLNLELHNMLYKVWEEKHGKKKVNLEQSKDAFFKDAVQRIYDHDSIHYSVAYGDRPLYESVYKDGPNSVSMDMAKVKALPFEECVRLFREEIYATALERWVIPTNYKISPRLAYARAVRKTIVSLTKGWSARFLVENYDVFRRPDMNYVRHHLSKKHLLIPLED